MALPCANCGKSIGFASIVIPNAPALQPNPTNSRGLKMPADQSSPARASEPEDPGHASRRLMRTALKGALATLDRETGHPYASLVLLATEPGGAPIFLISRLALHTRNLEQDPRASILFDGTGGLGDPLTGGRLTVTGSRGRAPAQPRCAGSWRGIPAPKAMPSLPISRSMSSRSPAAITSAASAGSSTCLLPPSWPTSPTRARWSKRSRTSLPT